MNEATFMILALGWAAILVNTIVWSLVDIRKWVKDWEGCRILRNGQAMKDGKFISSKGKISLKEIW